MRALSSFSQIVELSHNNIWRYFAQQWLFQVLFPKSKHDLDNSILTLHVWDEMTTDSITQRFHDFWYKYSKNSNAGSFFVLGDILSFTNITEQYEYKISFWWDSIEEIFIINNNTKETNKVDSVSFWKHIPFHELQQESDFNTNITEKLSNTLFIIDNLDFYQFQQQVFDSINNFVWFHQFSHSIQRQEKNLGISDVFLNNIDDLKHLLEDPQFSIKKIYTKNTSALQNFVEYNNLENIEILESKLTVLKSYQTYNTCVICDDNISRIFVKKRVKRNMSKKLDLLLQIKPGDYIVHVDHGIWLFQQIIEKQLKISSTKIIKKEYIELDYKNWDKLFVPITEVSRINKYVWVENPKLTWLSTKEWEKKLQKINENVEEIAHELLEAYAKRALQKWFAFPALPDEESKFFNSFEYTYTDDQFNIIREIYTDMESAKTMDRLVSGDVWFGKTEIAFAAIYKALINGKQAALISPLVVLAYEHYEKAQSRFSIFPFNIWVLTRFETAKNVKDTLEKLKSGKIDLVIWTHKLLSEDVEFKDLWVLVIDEEHKFWVKDKDKIKNVRGNIDVLALSATPIPRSLNMALNGIKSMSMLTTPPVGRRAIETIVSQNDENIIKDAWLREFERGGQLFFIHNKVTTIESMRDRLSIIFPKKKIIIAHGQLPGDQLEKRILAFKKREFDILLATTVIENGIDFSNVNTIFINDAYNFGISQIHQLRWRVGRSDTQGFCYLLFNRDKIKEDAAKRLKTIVDYSHLWAGFELAIKDLEIRGWGDILWIKQSGQSTEVWVNLYLEMLENKIEELKRTGLNINQSNDNKENTLSKWLKINTTIDLQLSAFIDNDLFNSELDKINFYREIESLEELEDLENIVTDFKEINTDINIETQNFFDMLEVKLRAPVYKILAIKKIGINYQIDFHESITLDELKSFLKIDHLVKFEVNKLHRLRSPVKKFKNDEEFLKYLKTLFTTKFTTQKKKIKLKKRL